MVAFQKFYSKILLAGILCLLIPCITNAQSERINLRLDGKQSFFVTLEEIDEVVAADRSADRWSLGNRFELVETRTTSYPDSMLLVFYDLSDGSGVRVPLVLSYDEYFEQRAAAQFRRLWPRNVLSHIQQVRSNRDPENLLSLDIPFELPGILGGGTPNFSITGRQRIEFSGRSEWTDGQVRTATNRVSRFPNVAMKQEQQFTVNGNIGQKVRVTISQDSQAFSDLENSIQLIYEDRLEDGREGDGIIRSFEAGNVSLNLDNAEFTGYTAQHSGLFGLKLRSQLGGVSFTAIMSQEKGEGQSANFQAGSQGSQQRINDTDFRRRTYFFVDSMYQNNYSRRDLVTRRHIADPDSIETIRVFVLDLNSQRDLANLRKVVAYVEPPISVNDGPFSPPDSITEAPERGDFRELQINEFAVDRDLGYIILNTPLQINDILAISYVTVNRFTGERIQYGNVPVSNDLESEAQLRLLKSRTERPPPLTSTDPNTWGTWRYEWRNVYFLGRTEINPDGFDLKVFKNSASGAEVDVNEEGVTYLQLLGLDRRGIEPGSGPDQLVDIDYDIINFQRGEIIFPDLYPFASNLLANNGGIAFPSTQVNGLADQTPELYIERTNNIVNNIANLNKYYMLVESKDRQAQYSLGRTNIIEGSEEVKLNGRRLVAGQDYILLYEVGQIRFLTEEALNPNADVTVDYQFAPFFQPAANTLMGFQSRYDIGSNNRSWIRGTFLYRADKTLDQKSRIGREVGRSILWDIDTRLNFEPGFMTSFVNLIPFVESNQASTLNIEAEFAQSIPNPNTFGDAFIDDFEGSKEETDLGVIRTAWVPSSTPDGMLPEQRAELIWYNPFEQVAVTEIFPAREVTIQDSRQHVLTLDFDPAIPDLRWGTPIDDDFLTEWSQDSPDALRNRWAGVMRPLTGATIDQTRSQFIEIWVNGDGGELHIDLGSITEDVNGNMVFDTEDDRSDGFGNNLLDEGEDTGIDKTFDEDEVGFDPITKETVPYDPVNNPDPHRDNFFFNSSTPDGNALNIDYSRINGMEDNVNDPDRGRRPNTEDINNSGFLDNDNNYFRYTIDLSADSDDTSFVAGGNLNRSTWGDRNSWRMYRIPLEPDKGVNPVFSDSIGLPNFALIEMARIWTTAVDRPNTIRIASIQIVGNRWQQNQSSTIIDSSGTSVSNAELSMNGETFNVSVKNTFDNPDDYVSPPGAIIEIDRVTGVQHREQSLVLNYENLQPNHEGQASQTFFNDQDYTLYNDLRLFVWGSSEFVGNQSPELYIRFGNSETDYYEYRTRVVPGWAPENEVRVIFNDLTAFKNDTDQARMSSTTEDTTVVVMLSNGVVDTALVTTGTSPRRPSLKQAILKLENGREYRVQGIPSLSRVRQFIIGVANPYDEPLRRGEIWLDELRTGDVRKNKGLAGRIRVDASFADFATVRGNFSQVGSHYRRIGQPENNGGSTTTLMDVQSNVKIDKFFPESWGLNLPVDVGWQRTKDLPRLLVGSDIILLRREQREEQRTERNLRRISASYSKRSNDGFFLTDWTLDRIQLNFAASENINRTVTNEDTSSSYNAGIRWNLTPRRPHTVNLFKWAESSFIPKWFSDIELRYLPTNLDVDARVNRTKQNGVNRQFRDRRTERFTRTLVRTARAKVDPFKALAVDYSLSLTNDMRADSTISIKEFKFGPEIDHNQAFSIEVRPEIASWVRPQYSFRSQYRENRNPQLQLVGQSPEDRTVNQSNRQAWRSTFDLSRMITSAFGRPSRRSRPSDDEENQGPQVGAAIGRGVRAFLGILSPVNLTVSRDKAQQIFGLRSRPTLSYRFGFTEDPGVIAPPPDTTGGSQVITIQRDQRSQSASYGFDTGLELFADLNIATRPIWRNSTRVSANTNIETRSRTWPEASVRWSPPLRNFETISKIFRRVDINSGYSHTVNTTENINLAAANPNLVGSAESRTVETAFSPLVGFVVDWAVGLTTRVNYDTKTSDQRLGLSSTDQQTKDQTLSIALDYRIQPGFTIPFFGGGKQLKGSLNLQTQIIRTASETLISRDNATFTPSNGRREISIRTRSDYQFSRRIRGGLTVEWTNTENSITKEKRRIRQGGFWTEFLFN